MDLLASVEPADPTKGGSWALRMMISTPSQDPKAGRQLPGWKVLPMRPAACRIGWGQKGPDAPLPLPSLVGEDSRSLVRCRIETTAESKVTGHGFPLGDPEATALDRPDQHRGAFRAALDRRGQAQLTMLLSGSCSIILHGKVWVAKEGEEDCDAETLSKKNV